MNYVILSEAKNFHEAQHCLIFGYSLEILRSFLTQNDMIVYRNANTPYGE